MNKIITEEMYANHDCHLSEEDGCETCVAYWEHPYREDEYKDAVEIASKEALIF